MSRASEKSMSSRGKARILVILISVGIGGVVLILALFAAMLGYERQTTAHEFDVQSNIRANAIRQAMAAEVASLQAMAAFFVSSDEVVRDEFVEYAALDLQRSEGLRMVAWLPQVPYGQLAAVERNARRDGVEDYQVYWRSATPSPLTEGGEHHFPVNYVFPFMENDKLLGLDATSIPAFREAMITARDTAKAVLLDAQTLWEQPPLSAMFSMVVPVYRRDAADFTTAGRREGLRGFLVGTYDLAALVEHGLGNVEPAGLNIAVLAHGGDDALRYTHYSRTLEAETRPATAAVCGKNQPLVGRSELLLNGRGWRLVFTPSDEFMAANALWGKWAILPAGATVLALLCWLVYTQYSEARRIQVKVEERTAELADLNVSLLQEVDERKKAEQTVREQIKFTQSVLDSIPCPVFYQDHEGYHRITNRAFQEGLGISHERAVRSTIHDILPREIAEEQYVIEQRVRQSGQADVRETHLILSDNQPREILISRAQVPDVDGHEPGLVGVIFDITDRKRMETALRIAEQRNRAILDNVRLGIALIDDDMRVLSANTQFRKWFPQLDIGQRSMCGLQFCSIAAGQSCEQCPIHETIHTATLNECVRIIRRDGEDRHYRMVVSPISGDDGSATSAIILLDDITEQICSERERLRIHAAINSTSDSVLVVDLDGHVEYANLACENLLGLSLEELRQSGLSPCFANPSEAENLMQCIARFENWTGEVTLVTANGRTFPAFLRSSAVLEEEGGFVGSAMIINDITKQRQREQEMQQATKLMSIGQLAAGIAHEINTPSQYVGDNIRFLKDGFADLLALVKLNVELLRRQQQDGAADESFLGTLRSEAEQMDLDFLIDEVPLAIEQSMEGINRIATIVQAMKAFSHPGQEHEKQAVDINRAIESTVTISRNEWKYHAEMSLDLDPALPRVHCVADEMNQVFLNLIVNAAQAVQQENDRQQREKGLIEISTAVRGGMVEICVRDTGCGIPEYARDRIFDPFFTTKGVGEGTGQGLSIVHSIVVKRHGGQVKFDTETGEGTTFIVSLPLESAAATGADIGSDEKTSTASEDPARRTAGDAT